MTDREQLKTNLKEWIATVAFEKKDGTLRELRCTLNSKYLPEQEVLEEGEVKKTRAVNGFEINLWSLAKKPPARCMASVYPLNQHQLRTFHLCHSLKKV